MQKIWQKSYPEYVSQELDLDALPDSIADLIRSCCEKYQDKPALYSMGAQLTYNEFLQHAIYFATFLQCKLLLKKGDRVALMLPNVMQYPVAMLAAWLCGLVVVNVNPMYTARELVKQLSDADVETVIVLANFAHVFQHALPETRITNVIVTEIGDLCGMVRGTILNFAANYIKKAVPDWFIPEVHMFSKALSYGRRKRRGFTKVAVKQDDLALLQYTGGTTGISKGAMITHRNLLANLEQCYSWMGNKLEVGQEINVTVLPLYHIFSLTACCLVCIKVGAAQLMIANPRDVPGMVKTLSKYKFSMFMGLTTLFNALLNTSKFRQLDFSSLKLTVAGGMAMQSSVAAKWQELTNSVVLQGYGLTEASPVVSMNPLNQTEFTGSIGLVFPNIDISIRDMDGNEVALGEEGELWVKGPNVMRGYWHQEHETQNVLTEDGWLKTGDLVMIDEKGYLYLIDRKKDMIVVAGYNVYPNEIEDVIAAHPLVLEVAAVGEPSLHAGEVVKVFVVRKDESLTKNKLIAFCKDRLTSYKVPKRVEFRSSLPKSNVGKILRRVLREDGKDDVPVG